MKTIFLILFTFFHDKQNEYIISKSSANLQLRCFEIMKHKEGIERNLVKIDYSIKKIIHVDVEIYSHINFTPENAHTVLSYLQRGIDILLDDKINFL